MEERLIGLVPAAGKGVRLNLPFPKELYPVAGVGGYRPAAQFVLDNLQVAGVNHVVLVINETKHQLIGHFGDGHRFGLTLSYVVQEPLPQNNSSTSPGLAHALDCGYHLTRGKTVFFGMPDTIMEPREVFRLMREEARDQDDAILALFPTTRPEKFGMVRTGDEGRVEQVIDKPRETDLTHMWGCIMWRPRFTEHLHESVQKRGIADFAQILNEALSLGMVLRSVRLDEGTYCDLGTYEEIADMEKERRHK
ncbi:MAG: NTP transferase domain-containing protein [Bryobacterales bacterium]|nr:NTP transferase domain-containing protein [Bryobacterales bacterium]